ncbi:hypothetical protein SAMN05192559_10359 [Halobacillus karajensis]|uniref:DUF456 domain-containing protein n=1 Tax=Halobacillus karajensis TaxID=195088 RepID=A0A024P4E3_9BACI|nr:DUF456 domain-containing protein [Halobacillus karajensis]CDQ19997.1 hypothetical protein BN982_02304 [Halobacillus karajensis]CDQ22457.1 hypothetical protein BN983_00665 [Halobacillus karajensis]CDQ28300.1 hypothetical protein BN981_02594 [Halobacillus karajensis]SEH68440.1 hypothetical protein SAMN05192559_10359 [Halobacillus karajensis]
MDILIWVIIIACFIASFASVIFPIIPAPLVLWIGFLTYGFFIDGRELSIFFWIGAAVLTVLLIISDIIANSYFVKKYGGSKWGERAAAIGVIVGSFIIPPLGILIVPFVLVILVELVQKRAAEEAFKAAVGSFFGFLSGTVAKIVIQAMMIIWFFFEI